jgi:sulfur carrier protein ThiS
MAMPPGIGGAPRTAIYAVNSAPATRETHIDSAAANKDKVWIVCPSWS